MTHYRSKDERDLATWARGRGWEQGSRNGMGHLTLRWPRTGAKVPISAHSHGRSVENTKAQLLRTEELGTSRPENGTVRPDPRIAELSTEVKQLREKLSRAQAGEYAAQQSLVEAKSTADEQIARLQRELRETWVLAEGEAAARKAAEAALERLRDKAGAPQRSSSRKVLHGKKLGMRVRTLRVKLGLTQRQVGRDAGLAWSYAQAYVSCCERHRPLPQHAQDLLVEWLEKHGG